MLYFGFIVGTYYALGFMDRNTNKKTSFWNKLTCSALWPYFVMIYILNNLNKEKE